MAEVEVKVKAEVKAEGDTIQSFQKHIEDMRSLTLCKVCLKPFFEPYIISCGHTYCYGCLRSWFGNTTDRKKTKSCPDCRITVKVQPAPNYILRDLTHMFIGRAELLPEDESVQEHAKDKEDAAAQLMKDREGSGLFQGVFKQREEFPYMRGPLHDFEDGVDRCPACFHEIEDGVCSGCGRPLSDYSSESDEDSMDIPMPGPPRQAFYGVESDSDDDDTEDESNISGPDEYDRHDDFLDNEDEDDVDDLSETDMAETELYENHRFARFDPFGYNAAAFRPHNLAGSEDDSDSDSDIDVDEDIVRGILPRRRPRVSTSPRLADEVESFLNDGSPRLIGDDSATNYDESEEEDSQEYLAVRAERRADRREARRAREIEAELEVEREVQAEIDATRQLSSRAAAPPANRRRPVVISDDEDDESAQEEDDSHGPRARTVSPASGEASEEDGKMSDQVSNQESDSNSDSDAEVSGESQAEDDREPQQIEDTEDSDDTIMPPQSRHMRKQRLQNQRARRPHQHQAQASSTDLSSPQRRDYLYGRQDDALGPRGSRGRAARVY